jgi:hypothetical protein
MMPFDMIAWHQGELAYHYGMFEIDCPYPSRCSEYGYWRSGWLTGQKLDRPEWKQKEKISLTKVNDYV